MIFIHEIRFILEILTIIFPTRIVNRSKSKDDYSKMSIVIINLVAK